MPSETLGLIDLFMTANGGSLDAFAAAFGDLYPQLEKHGVESASRYMADMLNRYARNAPYNYVSYASIGGFYSDAQRRFVMAGLNDGSIDIPYSRSSGNHYETVGVGADMRVESTNVSMYYSMHDEGQARMQMLRGWSKVGDLLIANSDKILVAFEKGVIDAEKQLQIDFTDELSAVAP